MRSDQYYTGAQAAATGTGKAQWLLYRNGVLRLLATDELQPDTDYILRGFLPKGA
jgi:hypothetical protein